LIKEKYCYISQDIDNEIFEPKFYELPDGNNIVIGDESFLAPEILFKPKDEGSDSIDFTIMESILNFDIEEQILFYKNIVLSGGNSCFKGLKNRLKTELESCIISNIDINIIANNKRRFNSFIGASILGSCSNFIKDRCVSKEVYEEVGPRISNIYFIN